MTSPRIVTLLERLRVQSIIRRLVRDHGAAVALQTVLTAVSLEFPEHTAKQRIKSDHAK